VRVAELVHALVHTLVHTMVHTFVHTLLSVSSVLCRYSTDGASKSSMPMNWQQRPSSWDNNKAGKGPSSLSLDAPPLIMSREEPIWSLQQKAAMSSGGGGAGQQLPSIERVSAPAVFGNSSGLKPPLGSMVPTLMNKPSERGSNSNSNRKGQGLQQSKAEFDDLINLPGMA
jgi:hypothetical protein